MPFVNRQHEYLDGGKHCLAFLLVYGRSDIRQATLFCIGNAFRVPDIEKAPRFDPVCKAFPECFTGLIVKIDDDVATEDDGERAPEGPCSVEIEHSEAREASQSIGNTVSAVSKPEKARSLLVWYTLQFVGP